VNDHSHFSKLTDELELFLSEKSAFFTASENLDIMFCFNVHSKGYSFQEGSVILKYHINFFLPDPVNGEYSHGHFGKDASTEA
jgi:hypothetical protein